VNGLDISVAAQVLERVFDLTRMSQPDWFVGQQLARLYTFDGDWSQAIKYGEMITKNGGKPNSYLLDTLARVYKIQMERISKKCKDESLDRLVSAKSAVVVLNLAFQAIDVFRDGQEATKDEEPTDLTRNMAVYFHELLHSN
jgi:hypothetical protein